MQRCALIFKLVLFLIFFMRHFIILSLLIIPLTIKANYAEYSSEIQKSEHFIIENKLDSALFNYLIVLKKYDYPYAKEIMQAAYISCYVHDKNSFSHLLKKAFQNGMTIPEYNSLIETWNTLNNELFDDNSNHLELRRIYLDLLNKEKMSEYVKLDFTLMKIQKKLRGSENDQNQYYNQMTLLRNQYLRLIEKYGYTNDKETGRKFKRKIVRCHKKNSQNHFYYKFKNGPSDSLFENRCVKFEINNNSIWNSINMGAWFLTHYVTPNDLNQLDSTIFSAIEIGVNKLEASPYLLVNLMESTRLKQNEFALTYYSRLWLSLKMSFYSKYNIPQQDKTIINSNRSKYGIRSLEQEEKLLRTLYRMKTNNELPTVFKNEELQSISFENKLFINIMV